MEIDKNMHYGSDYHYIPTTSWNIEKLVRDFDNIAIPDYGKRK